jgi:hypothetical protein
MALALLAVLTVLVLVVAVPRMRGCERLLTGFWAGDPAFLASAGLSEMYLYLAPPAHEPGEAGCRRQGYIVMATADGQLISNQSISLSWGGWGGRCLSALKAHFASEPSYQIPHLRIAYDAEPAMPSVVSLSLNPAEGALALHSDEKLYAYLIKDNEASAAAQAAWAAPL